MVARRIPILAKLIGAYLVPTVVTVAGFGLAAHYIAARSLEVELGRRLTAIASAVTSEVSEESMTLLQPGDESTRTYRNVKKRLDEIRAATGVARVYLFDRAATSRVDTDGLPIGERYFRLDAQRLELDRVFSGSATASILFRGHDGGLYKSGFAPLIGPSGTASFAVGVDGAAATYEELVTLRRTLLLCGVGGVLAVVGLSVLVARLLVRPLTRLGEAAARIARGDLTSPVISTSRDEVGLVAETLEGMRAELRRRDEHQQMMLAGIAHEVRNPLGGLALYAGLLRDELTGDHEKLDHVRRIEREVEHLRVIVADFLDYARRPALACAPVEIDELLIDVRAVLGPSAQQRRVAIELEVCAATCAADRGQLRRALLNLLQNAIQACPTDGSGRVVLGCRRDSCSIMLSVSDNGHGIAQEAKERVFTPFFTTKQSGTGLGLAFVRDIARDHGARLELDSTVGSGTTFTLTLKASEA